MKLELRAAFESVRRGYSVDRVVADPHLNAAFLAECRRLGLNDPEAVLNQSLLNLRKARGLRGANRSLETSFPEEDDYRFASEIAARFLERRDGISLDQIICDPEKATEFDELAARIAPGYSSLQYRWAALNLRKLRKLRPEIIGKALPSKEVLVSPISDLVLADLPSEQGLYIFFNAHQSLYVGESGNLRNRLEKHLDHSDNKGLAHWLWEHGTDTLLLELHILDASISTRVRRALEAELIASRRPVFNVKSL